jgi:uncharacterized protein YndB with AHSA1/START domain
MTSTEFVYTTYIKTTPERLWQALTDPAFTSQYWGVTFETDWTVGSPVTWHQGGVTITDPNQTVLEYEPCRRLAYTWHALTQEHSAWAGFSQEFHRKAVSERRSQATYELEPHGQSVKLTLTHDGFEPGSVVLESVSQGWPSLLSSLKTLLETGHPLPA